MWFFVRFASWVSVCFVMPTTAPMPEVPLSAATPPLGAWLEAYVKGDEAAFAKLVRHTTALVMAAALRRCGGRHALAEEAAQVVFVDLARRAPSLRADATLVGWLHQRATRAAGDLMKQEQRRAVREQEAAPPAALYSLNEDAAAARWEDCREQVDEALSSLKLEERTAVLLRCAEGRDFEAVGVALSCSGEAARKKVSRALEKLRVGLGRHRNGVSAAVIISGLAADQAKAATGAAGAGIDALSSQLAGKAFATAGKITLLARALPWLKAVGTGTAAAAALWAWPVAARLDSRSTAVTTPAPAEVAANTVKSLGYPQVPAQLVPASGLSLDEIVQRLAAMAEGPELPDSSKQFGFYYKQIPPQDSGLALRKLRKAVSARGWHDILRRNWAESLITTWAPLDPSGALDFIVSSLGEQDFKDAEGILSSTLMNNLLSRTYDAACGIVLFSRTPSRPGNAAALVADVTARLTPSADGRWTPAQQLLISRGTDLARAVMMDGNGEAMGLLVDLVNLHGFKWMDGAAHHLKTIESLTGLLGHLPRLASPARRSALQLSILGRLSELDLPEAIYYQVEMVTDPAQRWKWASAVASPPHSTTIKGERVVRHNLKPQADWWLRQAPAGQEAECLGQIVRTWLNVDPEWGAQWAAPHFEREAILQMLREIVRSNAQSYAMEMRPHSSTTGRLKLDAEVLRKLDPDGTPAFFKTLVKDYGNGSNHQNLKKLLLP